MRLEVVWNGDSQCIEHSKESSEGETNCHHALHLHLLVGISTITVINRVEKCAIYRGGSLSTLTIVKSRLALFSISSFFSAYKHTHTELVR